MLIIVLDYDDESIFETQILSFWMENQNHKKIYDLIPYAYSWED